jgi:hypothetical protein
VKVYVRPIKRVSDMTEAEVDEFVHALFVGGQNWMSTLTSSPRSSPRT